MKSPFECHRSRTNVKHVRKVLSSRWKISVRTSTISRANNTQIGNNLHSTSRRRTSTTSEESENHGLGFQSRAVLSKSVLHCSIWSASSAWLSIAVCLPSTKSASWTQTDHHSLTTVETQPFWTTSPTSSTWTSATRRTTCAGFWKIPFVGESFLLLVEFSSLSLPRRDTRSIRNCVLDFGIMNITLKRMSTTTMMNLRTRMRTLAGIEVIDVVDHAYRGCLFGNHLPWIFPYGFGTLDDYFIKPAQLESTVVY